MFWKNFVCFKWRSGCDRKRYLYLKGEVEEAVEHYQTAITLNPNKRWTSVIAQTLGFVYQENKQDVDSAISAYQTAYMLTPDDIDIYINNK